MTKRIHVDAKNDHLLGLAEARHEPVGAAIQLAWNALAAAATEIEIELLLNASDGIEGTRRATTATTTLGHMGDEQQMAERLG